MRRRLLLLLIVAVVAACASRGRHIPPPPMLILISIDGFRADYLERGLTPTLALLADQGVRAQYMRPSFPSLTFPNHYTLITGLRPDRHGIVANTMHDETIPGQRFSATNREAIENPAWWSGAVPLWTSLRRAGARSATMFWPGSEAPVHGAHPDYWQRFDEDLPAGARVERVLEWIDLPAALRPQLITLYFNSVDKVGHHDGPDSAALDRELERVDAALAQLLDGLARRGLRDAVNLAVVSDHGMTATSPERVVHLDDVISLDDVRVGMWGVLTGVTPLPGRESVIEGALLAAHASMQCWRKSELPARLRYGSHARVPPLLCIAAHGWTISSRDFVARRRHFSLGEHGYDIDHPEMRALFIANGPAFARGVVIAPFDNVDVYVLLAHVLGVDPEPNDGDIGNVAGALAR